MELWLIRHPRPLVAPDVCYGRMDLAVVAEDLERAVAELAARLPAGHRLRTSPARRCLELARRLHPAPHEDPRLHERSFGDWEGLTWDEIGRPPLDAWAADPWDFAPPAGESARMLAERIDGVLEEELALGGFAVWVTHQGVARAVAGRLLGLPAQQWMTLTLGCGEALALIEEEGVWRTR